MPFRLAGIAGFLLYSPLPFHRREASMEWR